MIPATYTLTRDFYHGEQEVFKESVLHPSSAEALSEQTQLDEGDHSSRSNTPSLTNASSWSNPSSIIFCDTCGNSGPHCSCSDSEKGRYAGSDEWTRSPHCSPALTPRSGKGLLLSPPRLRYGRAGSHLPYSSPMRRILTRSTVRLEDGEVDSKPTNTIMLEDPPTEKSPPRNFPDKSTLHVLPTEHHSMQPENAVEFPISDSEPEDEEDDSDDTDELDEDNDWSGQDTSLEAVVLNVIGEDLPLAAHLIPILHRLRRSEFTTNATEKLGSWRYNVVKSAQGTSTGEEQTSKYTADQESNPRKRQRRQGDSKDQNPSKKVGNFEEGEDDEDDDPQDIKDIDDEFGTEGQQALPCLACPFHKRDTAKYSIQYGDIESTKKTQYRSCGGPGFKNIQRLKEHLKRKHHPVQCARCYRIFPGSDRAACVLALQGHLQLPEPCQRGPDSEKEGISEAQWASLDKKKSSKKSHTTSRIALWMEYWDILFPGIRQPETPCKKNQGYDNQFTPNRPPQPGDVKRFANLFKPMLDLKVSQRHICFLEGEEEVMKGRIEDMVYKAFEIYLGLKDSSSITNSSSSKSFQRSSGLGGSFQNISTPRTSRQHTSSGSLSTAAYSLDVASSPMANSMAPRSLSQGQPSRMAPPVMAPMLRMPTQNFPPTSLPSTMPNEGQAHGVYTHNMASGLGEDPFSNSGLVNGIGQWGTFSEDFYGGHQATDMNQPDFSMIAASDENRGGLRDFGQHPYQGNLRYDGPQQ